jgi:hypothetical protein
VRYPPDRGSRTGLRLNSGETLMSTTRRSGFSRIEYRVMTTKSILLTTAGVLVVTGAAAAWALYAYWDQAVPLGGMAINYVRSWSAPAGTITTQLAAASKDAEDLRSSPAVWIPASNAATWDWPSYNKTLTSERYSQLTQITIHQLRDGSDHGERRPDRHHRTRYLLA